MLRLIWGGGTGPAGRSPPDRMPHVVRFVRRDGFAARSEEAELLRAVAGQHVLGLWVVIEHHLVGLAAHAGLLVAAERRVRRIGVIAVRPHPPGLDRATEAVAATSVAAPHAGTEAVQRVVGDRERFLVGLEGRH